MSKITMIISFLFLLNLNSMCQNKGRNITFIYEVDSIFNYVKSLKNDQIILYYPDGAVKYGIILWAKEANSNGLAFKKTTNGFLVKDISKKNINKFSLLKQFADSFLVFKNYAPASSYNTSHDFNLVWVYSVNMKTDTVVKRMSEMIGGSDRFGRAIFLKFEKLFDLSISSRSPSSRRKKSNVNKLTPSS